MDIVRCYRWPFASVIAAHDGHRPAIRRARTAPRARWRRLGAWLGILALVVPLWVPYVHHDSVLGDTMLDALLMAASSAAPTPTAHPRRTPLDHRCPICLALSCCGALATPPPAPIVRARAPYAQQPRARWRTFLPRAAAANLRPPSRASPLPA